MKSIRIVASLAIFAVVALTTACGRSEDLADLFTFDQRVSVGFYKLPIDLRFGASVTSRERLTIMRAGETWAAAFGGRPAFSFDESIPPCDETDTCDEEGFISPLGRLRNDGVNSIEMAKNWTRVTSQVVHEVIGITYVRHGVKRRRYAGIEADVVFNREGFDLVDAEKISGEVPVDNRKLMVDLESLALHELGHALGLRHNKENASSPMYPRLNPYKKQIRRSLSSDDYRAVARLYRVGAGVGNEGS